MYNQQAGVESPEQPLVPPCAVHVWEWWWELNTRRPPGFEALAPLSYGEIHSWILLTGKYLAPEEVRWLITMDNAWLQAITEERKHKRQRDKEEQDRKNAQGKRR